MNHIEGIREDLYFKVYKPLSWSKFKEKHNIHPELLLISKKLSLEEKDKYLSNEYKKNCKPISIKDIYNISESDLKMYKEEEEYYNKQLSKNNHNVMILSFVYYLIYCNLKDAFEYWEPFIEKPAEEIIIEKQKKEDEEFYTAVRQHKLYKFHYYLGLILWMTSCFWGPYLFGIIYELAKGTGSYIDISNIWVLGFAYVLAFSFTTPITLPLSFVIGAFVHPRILKALMFTPDKPYCENLMKELNHSTSQEKLNGISIATATMLSKYLK